MFFKQKKNLIKCSKCGHQISKAARSCPNCGDPVGVMGFLVESKITLLITGVLSILGVNGIYFFTSDDSSSENLILNSPTQSTIEATMQENTNINQHPQTSENNNPFQGFYKSNQVATQTLAQNCKICQGTGFKTCSKCKDSGKPGYIGICSDCNGTGKCKKCEGTGTVIKKRDFWSTHNNWNTSNSNQHINIKKIPDLEKCPACKGKKKCPHCNGTGWEKCRNCNQGKVTCYHN